MTLARAGLHALLVDAIRGASFKVGEGLPPAAKPLLRRLGVWERLQADGHVASRGNESAWGDSEVRSTSFVRDPNGHGWHLDRVRFDALLHDYALEVGVSMWTATRARQAARVGGMWGVTLETGTGLRVVGTPWLIDCTGRRAWAARLGGARRVRVDRLLAFVSRYHQLDAPTADVDSVTLVESAPHGWWYTSRLPTGDRVAAYLTDEHDASARRAASGQGFTALLDQTRHVRSRLSRHDYSLADPPRIVAADSSRLDRVAGDGWIAAGDAAVSFDPLSSQGILTAMFSGMTAARALVSHLSGDRTAIETYGARIDSIFATYLAHRGEYYARERRWARHPFWRRRHADS